MSLIIHNLEGKILNYFCNAGWSKEKFMIKSPALPHKLFLCHILFLYSNSKLWFANLFFTDNGKSKTPYCTKTPFKGHKIALLGHIKRRHIL